MVWCGVVWCGVVWCCFFFVFFIQFNVPFKIISLLETSQTLGGAKREYPGKTTWHTRKQNLSCLTCGQCGARTYVVWCGVVWCGVVWCNVVWCGVMWCGVVWWGWLWCGVVWCGGVGCGAVECGRVG